MCERQELYRLPRVFRSVEALLNYIEACYERTGAIDATADRYWKAIRAVIRDLTGLQQDNPGYRDVGGGKRRLGCIYCRTAR